MRHEKYPPAFRRAVESWHSGDLMDLRVGELLDGLEIGRDRWHRVQGLRSLLTVYVASQLAADIQDDDPTISDRQAMMRAALSRLGFLEFGEHDDLGPRGLDPASPYRTLVNWRKQAEEPVE